MGQLVVVELQDVGERLEDLRGRVAVASALGAQVVVDADPGEHGDLFAPQAGHPPPAEIREARLFGRDELAAGAQVVLGVTGLTAWVGLTKVLDPKPGGTLVVTGAAGAVGSAAAQFGKRRGHRVVGIARGREKTRHLLDDLGLDAAVDHSAPGFAEQLAHAVPDGIDTVYDNVGASLLPAVPPADRTTCRTCCGPRCTRRSRSAAST